MKNALKLMAAVTVAVVGIAVAGDVADRVQVTTSSSGAATWTNTFDVSAIELKRFTIKGADPAINTVTVSRVTSDGLWTNACGSVVTAGGVGTQATIAYQYLLYGDKLVFSSHVPSSTVALVEFEVQKH